MVLFLFCNCRDFDSSFTFFPVASQNGPSLSLVPACLWSQASLLSMCFLDRNEIWIRVNKMNESLFLCFYVSTTGSGFEVQLLVSFQTQTFIVFRESVKRMQIN
jgi:hypothetical protein